MSGSTIERVQHWYQSHCNGDWEHGEGIEITTIDNPGWRVTIHITDTELADVPFETVELDYEHETNWLRCWVENGRFECACGPLLLEKVLAIFLDWAEMSSGMPHA